MNSGTETGDMIVRLAMQGSVFFLKITGQAAASVLSFIAAAVKENAKSSGRMKLKNLLETGSELKVFTVQGEDNFKEFLKEAKRYGMLFSVVKRSAEDKENGIYDIMVRTEDASKLNRIIEKHHYAEVQATTRTVAPEEAQEQEIIEVRDLMSKMMEQDLSNPDQALEDPSRSGALLRARKPENRPSIIKEVDEIVKGMDQPEQDKTAEAMMPNLMTRDDEEDRKEERALVTEAQEAASGETKRGVEKEGEAKVLLSEMMKKEPERSA